MVQKRIRITTAIVTAACLFSACAQKAAHQPVLQMTEQEQNTVNADLYSWIRAVFHDSLIRHFLLQRPALRKFPEKIQIYSLSHHFLQKL